VSTWGFDNAWGVAKLAGVPQRYKRAFAIAYGMFALVVGVLLLVVLFKQCQAPTSVPATAAPTAASPTKVEVEAVTRRLCTDVARILPNRSLADGTHQVEAWALLQKAVDEARRLGSAVDEGEVRRATSLWHSGQPVTAIEVLAGAMRCSAQ
jgi:hypothetical protein